MSKPQLRIVNGIALDQSLPESNVGWQTIAVEGRWDGHWMGPFELTPRMFEEMSQHRRAKSIDTVVDYEHATLFSDKAPASGWIKQLLPNRGENGQAQLLAQIEWTAAAAAHIRASEYRYLSPVILYHTRDRKSGRLGGASIHSLALTNTPFLEELPEVRLNSLRAALIGGLEATGEDKTMDEFLKALRAKLGLPEDAADEETLRALDSLISTNNSRGQQLTALHKRLGLPEDATRERAIAEIVALQNPASRVPADRVAVLEQQLAQERAERLVEAAQRDGKISADPEEVKFATDLALRDPEAFAAMLKFKGQAVPMSRVPHPSRQATDRRATQDEHSDEEASACKQLGLSTEDLDKYNSDDYVPRV